MFPKATFGSTQNEVVFHRMVREQQVGHRQWRPGVTPQRLNLGGIGKWQGEYGASRLSSDESHTSRGTSRDLCSFSQRRNMGNANVEEEAKTKVVRQAFLSSDLMSRPVVPAGRNQIAAAAGHPKPRAQMGPLLERYPNYP